MEELENEQQVQGEQDCCGEHMSVDIVLRKLRHQGRHLLMFLKWLVLGSALGLIIGGAAVFFHYSIEYAAMVQKTQEWMLLLLPVAGVAIILDQHSKASRMNEIFFIMQ